MDVNVIIPALHGNADRSTSQSVDKVNTFIIAARRYLIAVPEQSSQPGGFLSESFNIGKNVCLEK